jgi:hypothetical protein
MNPLFRYERRTEQLLGRRAFVLRLLAHFGVAIVIVTIALALGTIGNLVFAQAAPVDAFYGATMILTGMGPVDQIKATPTSEIFTSIYALLVGPVLLSIGGIILMPILHRFLHHFHLDGAGDDQPDEQGGSD